MQEKASDRQSELDVLRAKRAQESNERVAREKQKKEIILKQAANKDLNQKRL